MKLLMPLLAYVFAIVFGVVQVNGQNYPNELTDPCTGRHGGFARDLTSCPHYFACEEGVGFRGVCNANRWFDAERDLCVPANERRCFQCATNRAFYLSSVPRACNHYVQCFRGAATLHFCPQGLVYDGRSGIRQCNTPPAHGGCFRETDTNDVTSPLPRCPAVGNRPVYLRDQTDCSVFFVCTGAATPLRGQCQNGLHFNLRLGVCDHPRNAQCQTVPNPPPGGSAGPAVRCQRLGEFVPDRVHCNRYHICTNTGTTPASCNGNLMFDHRIRDCTRPENARCWAHDNPGPGPAPPLQTGPAVRCQRVGEFVPDRIHCNRYHICTNTGTQEATCAGRLMFDHRIRDCTRPENARCWAHDNPNPGPPPPQSGPAVRCQRLGEFVPDRVRCNTYHICTNTGTTPASCSGNLMFDHRIRDCTRPENARCWAHDNPEPNPPAPPPAQHGPALRCQRVGEWVPDRVRCNFYHVCTNTGTTEASCHPQLSFDHIVRDCILRDRARCWSQENQQGQPQTGPAVRCARVGEFVPDRTRCRHYHVCTSTGTTEAECHVNLAFDHVTRNCARRENARCWAVDQAAQRSTLMQIFDKPESDNDATISDAIKSSLL